MSRTFDNIAKLGTAQLATAEVVVLVKQGSPNFGTFAITARNRRNPYIFQVSLLARQFRGITFNCSISRVVYYVHPLMGDTVKCLSFGKNSEIERIATRKSPFYFDRRETCIPTNHATSTTMYTWPTSASNSARALALSDNGVMSPYPRVVMVMKLK
jgi:hypothetical protein